MPRRRKDPDYNWLPDRVYIHGNNYVYQPKAGGKIKLCPVSAGKLEVLKRHEQEQGRVNNGVFFESVIAEFYKSDSFQKLAIRTRKDYTSYQKTLAEVFGKMRPNAIEPHHVRLFMDALAKKRGTAAKPANATANLHKACLQKICSWALQCGKLKNNPCVGVEKCEVNSRDRYITDQEYQAIYQLASPACRVAMEISYLCMARIGDVMKLTYRDVLEDGLFIEQSKTGKKQIKLWSDRLRQAINDARSLPRKTGMTTIFLISKPDGSKYSIRTIQADYSKARDAAGITGCTLHDIKAKSISDFEGTLSEKQNAAGHTTAAQTANYDRKIKIVKTTR
ncbi:MAG: tyrosine-type recombinase/integrase [Paraglaciecola sp.]|nr:tyrosine-type recombinase/integrase [Paraglaciecola sp.]NCT48556.1 tyrosine-type recombinase/integrase [Paraglaciecola sp.]